MGKLGGFSWTPGKKAKINPFSHGQKMAPIAMEETKEEINEEKKEEINEEKKKRKKQKKMILVWVVQVQMIVQEIVQEIVQMIVIEDDTVITKIKNDKIIKQIKKSI